MKAGLQPDGAISSRTGRYWALAEPSPPAWLFPPTHTLAPGNATECFSLVLFMYLMLMTADKVSSLAVVWRHK